LSTARGKNTRGFYQRLRGCGAQAQIIYNKNAILKLTDSPCFDIILHAPNARQHPAGREYAVVAELVYAHV
jgi:hypothetical protein